MNKDQMIEAIEKMTVAELAELVKALEDKFGVSAAAPVAVAAAPEMCIRDRRTKDQAGLVIPVVITVYQDRSFTFITKTPPAAVLIKKACKIEHGSGRPNTEKVSKITKDQVREIATLKMPDLNAADVDAAMRMIAGTARSMGVEVVD